MILEPFRSPALTVIRPSSHVITNFLVSFSFSRFGVFTRTCRCKISFLTGRYTANRKLEIISAHDNNQETTSGFVRIRTLSGCLRSYLMTDAVFSQPPSKISYIGLESPFLLVRAMCALLLALTSMKTEPPLTLRNW